MSLLFNMLSRLLITFLPRSEHLKNRVEEINKGAYDELIEAIMQKPITEMQELYNNRDIEK